MMVNYVIIPTITSAIRKYKKLKNHSRISTSSHHPLGETTHIQIPNGSLVTIKRPDTLSVLRSPHGRHVIFGCREEEVAIEVELDHRDGSFVSLEQDGPLQFVKVV